jgi:Tol biopolymer transport system component
MAFSRSSHGPCKFRRLTHDTFQDLGGDWSPDGSQIAFTSPRNGSWDIYTIRPDGTDLTRITDSPNAEFSPSWSPDGGRIAYTLANWRRGWEDIAILNLDDPVQTRFVMRGSMELGPDLQPG